MYTDSLWMAKERQRELRLEARKHRVVKHEKAAREASPLRHRMAEILRRAAERLEPA